MSSNQDTGSDPFLMAQQKRIEAAKAKMAARQELLQERRRRETEKLYRVVGEACCKAVERAEFGPVVKEILNVCADERSKAFLRQKRVI